MPRLASVARFERRRWGGIWRAGDNFRMQGTDRWFPEADLPHLCTDAAHRSWLLERGSLTARLSAHHGEAAVLLIDEGLAPALRHEAERLGIPPNAACWVRCVLLVCQERPRVYARTVIPDWGPSNPWAEVQRLGQQPLGELLFRLPDLRRSPFEWARSLAWPHAERWQAGAPPEPVARRCVFERDRAPLLLTEVFLDLTPNAQHAA